MYKSEIESKISSNFAVKLKTLEWFILQGFLKNIIESEDLVASNFKSKEDCEVIETILESIQGQFLANLTNLSSELSELEKMLDIKPKSLYVPPTSTIIV